MSLQTLESHFASPERNAIEEIFAEHELIKNYENLLTVIDAMPQGVAVLNEHRQIVAANKAMTDTLGGGDMAAVLGLRPGELVGCKHADEMSAGCGTSETCRTCGAVAAILASQQGFANTRECRIAAKEGRALDLRVRATPLEIEGHSYTVFTVDDMSDENRRRVLERTFFHDILNSAGGVLGIAQVLNDDALPEDVAEFTPLLAFSAEQLVDEIHAQRDLLAAEAGNLQLKLENFTSRRAVEDVAAFYNHHPAGDSQQVVVEDDLAEVELTTARPLLSRVLGNMVKNALEASSVGEVVRVGCREVPSGVEFHVWNPLVMPEEIQLQVFKRSFSTKGAGRGIGTYSMLLLTERYLGGEVGFTSVEGEGTTFRATIPPMPPPQADN